MQLCTVFCLRVIDIFCLFGRRGKCVWAVEYIILLSISIGSRMAKRKHFCLRQITI